MADIGMERVALALVGLFEGRPRDFDVRGPVLHGPRAPHPRPARCAPWCTNPCSSCSPNSAEIEFTIGLVSGGGVEFVRAISQHLYGVPAELVVGTAITYDFAPARTAMNAHVLRTDSHPRRANEGPAKINTSRPSSAVARSWRPATPSATGDARVGGAASSRPGPPDRSRRRRP